MFCVYASTDHVAATVDIVHVVAVAVEPTNMTEEIEIDVATNNKWYCFISMIHKYFFYNINFDIFTILKEFWWK